MIQYTGNSNAVSEIKTKKGTVVGSRIHFSVDRCRHSATEIKNALKRENPKAKPSEIRALVGGVLRGEQDMRWATYEVAVSAMRSGGYVPDVLDVRKSSGSARFVRPSDGTKSAATLDVSKMTIEEKAATLASIKGCTVEAALAELSAAAAK